MDPEKARMIKISFKDIPRSTKIVIFDNEDKSLSKVWEIDQGDKEIEFDLPDSWSDPYRNILTTGYFIPDSYAPISNNENTFSICGSDYYADIDRRVQNEEQNKKSIEQLIHSIFANDSLSGRQKFFISLIALQSHFEYLIYGMLVLSGHISKTKFDNLSTQAARIPVAFSSHNTDFFSNQIEICPGKNNLGSEIQQTNRDNIEMIFEEVRKVRNKVVHRWGYKDLGQEKLRDIFSKLEEAINLNSSDDKFYLDACFVCVRLYAKTNVIGNQLLYFIEKEAVRAERKLRGYN